MEIIEMLAPKGTNCRPGIPLTGFLGITVHNTSNWSKGANAISHANYLRNGGKNNYVSWHYVVDKDRAVRCIPENETAWCAGDGANGNGNRKTINIEICDNQDGDIRRATDNAVELCAILLRARGIKTANGHLFQHYYWTRKDCPYDIRRGNPYNWDTFVAKVQEKLNGGSPSGADQILYPGSKVKFNGVFKADVVIKANSKYPNGAVGCYATCYGAPIGPYDYIPCGPLAVCNQDGSNANYNGIIYRGNYWTCDKIFTVVAVEAPNKRVPNGVATLEADGVRFCVDCGPLYEVSDR